MIELGNPAAALEYGVKPRVLVLEWSHESFYFNFYYYSSIIMGKKFGELGICINLLVNDKIPWNSALFHARWQSAISLQRFPGKFPGTSPRGLLKKQGCTLQTADNLRFLSNATWRLERVSKTSHWNKQMKIPGFFAGNFWNSTYRAVFTAKSKSRWTGSTPKVQQKKHLKK